jgi:hypothetical protein
MAPGLCSSIRLKVFNPADMNRAWITTVAAISAAAILYGKSMQVTHFGVRIREPSPHRSANSRLSNNRQP